MSNLEYQYQCGGCVYYDFQGDYKKGYCSWYRSYYYPGDNCSHQKPVNATSGCYITTIVCDVLGLDDDCSLLNNLRSFRDNILQKDAKFTPLTYHQVSFLRILFLIVFVSAFVITNLISCV